MGSQVSKKITGKTFVITSILTFLFGLVQIMFPSYVIGIIGLVAGFGLLIIGLVNIFLYF